MRENPLKLARERLNISRHELAVMSGVGPATIYQAERGTLTRVPADVAAVLGALGVDVVVLGRDYAAWRAALGDRVFAEVRSRQGFGAR